MEDEHVKPLKILIAATSALALASCSAGQITQTSDQVAAVDGASANSSDNKLAVRDVTIHVTDEGETGVKFTAINQDKKDATHQLRKITIDGDEVTIDGDTTFNPGCNLVGDIASEMTDLVEPDKACVMHVTTSITNPGYPLGGTKEVVFEFDSGSITTNAAVSAPVLQSGKVNRKTNAENHQHGDSHGSGHGDSSESNSEHTASSTASATTSEAAASAENSEEHKNH
ncbi:MAG: hypothetical protein Q4A82_03170 [Corynebacterium sp.]|nr:hypothetical protein [Corynebacterium sp.]